MQQNIDMTCDDEIDITSNIPEVYSSCISIPVELLNPQIHPI